jgi:hypothetical protein
VPKPQERSGWFLPMATSQGSPQPIQMNVPGEANTNNPVDPMEVWKRWNETSARMWSSILEESKQAFSDPFGLSRLWMKSMSAAQEQLHAKDGTAGGADPITAWKQWIDATTDAWKRASEAGKDAVEHSSNSGMTQQARPGRRWSGR